MKKHLFTLFLWACALILYAQERTITGTVLGEDGMGIPGVNVIVKGSATGTVTDIDGKYELGVPQEGGTLVFSYIGFTSKEIPLTETSSYDITMAEDATELGELVVTALGIKREKKALGYAVQEVGGDEVNKTGESNLVNSLSGKVAGVQIKQSGTMGASANITIRGNNSITGNNQPLFIVDGVPIANNTFNAGGQNRGSGGYDYGNLASDINPDDIESISVLKGASAAALYGSRASNGVILITTKKGKSKKGLGISVNSGILVSKINKATMPQHQKEYGAGYAEGFVEADIDGDGKMEKIVQTFDDASWGTKFDDGLMVVHWDALNKEEDNFGEKRPWVAGANGIDKFFETGIAATNSFAFSGGNDISTFRLSYTNLSEKGILPNSKINRNTFGFNGSLKLADQLTASINSSFVKTKGLGRAGTGYDGQNVMQSFGQWFQTNLDFERLKKYKSANGDQYSWNRGSWDNPVPLYFDNPYWVRYESFQNDVRNRVFGNVALAYQPADWVTITGKAATDRFTFVQEERVAKGSQATSDYTKRIRTFNENNYDLMASFSKHLTEEFTIDGLAGTNIRYWEREYSMLSTLDGLLTKGLYSVSNSANAEIQKDDQLLRAMVLGAYAQTALGYKGILFLDVAARNDWSSTLPKENNSYFYPSVSTSLIFSELLDVDAISFGKVRLSASKVGSDANPYKTANYFSILPVFSPGVGLFRVQTETIAQYSQAVLNNPDLKAETTTSLEGGLEMLFLKRRAGFDLAFYQNVSSNQILDLAISRASGYDKMFINAGKIQNTGIELALHGKPIENNDFTWDVALNWSKNKNKVVELADGIDNYQLGSFSGGITLNAEVGKPYGIIKGTDYVKHENGEYMVDDKGYYKISEEKKNIGNIQPDWVAGFRNSFTYKGVSLSVLFDMQKGGSIFSLNTLYGRATGVYAETAGNNDKGNPMRDDPADGGGIKMDGVKEDGTPNDIYVPVKYGGAFHWSKNPRARYVFDASYVKLREIAVSYNLPTSVIDNLPFTGASISIVARNLAILHKNTEHFDPEASLSAGNLQGYESGSYPSTRVFGFNLKLNF